MLARDRLRGRMGQCQIEALQPTAQAGLERVHVRGAGVFSFQKLVGQIERGEQGNGDQILTLDAIPHFAQGALKQRLQLADMAFAMPAGYIELFAGDGDVVPVDGLSGPVFHVFTPSLG